MNREEFIKFTEIITDPVEKCPEIILDMNIIDATNIVVLFAIQGKEKIYMSLCKLLGDKHGQLKFLVVLTKMRDIQFSLIDCTSNEEFVRINKEFDDFKREYVSDEDDEKNFSSDLDNLLKQNGISNP